MTREDQMLAIGKLCGWEPVEPRNPPGTKQFWLSVQHAFLKDGAYYGGFNALPRYLEDRNAMHEALRHLDDEGYLEFMLHLCDITGVGSEASKWTTTRALLEATTAQMAEAFLKAHNLYKQDHGIPH